MAASEEHMTTAGLGPSADMEDWSRDQVRDWALNIQGVDKDSAEILFNQNITVDDKDRYTQHLTTAINQRFYNVVKNKAHQCIKAPRFVPVLCKNSLPTGKFVIEVDVEPHHTFCENKLFHTYDAGKKQFFIREGSSSRNLLASNTSDKQGNDYKWYIKNVDKLSKLRNEAEDKVKSHKQGFELCQMITGGSGSLDRSYYIQVTNPLHLNRSYLLPESEPTLSSVKQVQKQQIPPWSWREQSASRRGVERSLTTLDVLCLNQCEEGKKDLFSVEQLTWWNFHTFKLPGYNGFFESEHFRYILSGKLIPELRSKKKLCALLNIEHEPRSGGTTLAKQTLWTFKETHRCAKVNCTDVKLETVAEQVLTLLNYGCAAQKPPVPVLLMIDNFRCMEDVRFLQQLIEEQCLKSFVQTRFTQVILLNSSGPFDSTDDTVFLRNQASCYGVQPKDSQSIAGGGQAAGSSGLSNGTVLVTFSVITAQVELLKEREGEVRNTSNTGGNNLRILSKGCHKADMAGSEEHMMTAGLGPSADIEDWSRNQVREWALNIRGVDADSAEILFNQNITGTSLKVQNITDLTELKLGPAKLIINAIKMLQPKRQCEPHPFGWHVAYVCYTEGDVLSAVEPGASNLIEPCHEFKEFTNTTDKTKMEKFRNETVRFAAACMNSHTNGTIHFGIKDQPHGEVCGVPVNSKDKDRYTQHVTTVINQRFHKVVKNEAHYCIKPPRFVPVLSKNSFQTGKFVIEVDVEPHHEFSKLFHTYNAGKKQFFIREGSSSRNLLAPNTSDKQENDYQWEMYGKLRQHDPDGAPSENNLQDQMLLGLREGPLSQTLRTCVRQSLEL
ncbi:hypothetical protein WMY93_012557 [Mugilogobius chulae]|uniref:Schlafen AlbA-2 domain-containing protein n=1 Tax=Mugilogobius chulae TaxID=88201 RepID=A0AAW0P9F2_9GOBI